MKTAHEFWQVVCKDAGGSGKHSDWVLARVASMVPGAELAASAALRVEVADRHARRAVAERVGTKLCAVLPFVRHQFLGTAPAFELAVRPEVEHGPGSVRAVQGLLSNRAAERAGV